MAASRQSLLLSSCGLWVSFSVPCQDTLHGPGLTLTQDDLILILTFCSPAKTRFPNEAPLGGFLADMSFWGDTVAPTPRLTGQRWALKEQRELPAPHVHLAGVLRNPVILFEREGYLHKASENTSYGPWPGGLCQTPGAKGWETQSQPSRSPRSSGGEWHVNKQLQYSYL